ncbi:hypothetical protein E2C01_033050 [Portunus trituberculatus]|uniref:Uncharacterized protein n=1 Tax=Portunus trituberculatus TaxID=210409 RepID=A0A5B7F353_PORTR|nr:hypothetical protein [Portunus trituberculatus]
MLGGRVQPILRRARTTSSRLVGRLQEAHSLRMEALLGDLSRPLLVVTSINSSIVNSPELVERKRA